MLFLAALVLSASCQCPFHPVAVGDSGADADAGPTVHQLFQSFADACAGCGEAPYLCAYGLAHAEVFYTKAVAAGRIAFSPALASACITAMATVPCGTLDSSRTPIFAPEPLPASCTQLLERSGTVPWGGSCFADRIGLHGGMHDQGIGFAPLGECADGLCSTFSSNGSCPGVCEPPRADGECVVGRQCQDGGGTLGSPCPGVQFCQLGFYCDSTQSKCLAQPAADQACTLFTSCQWGSACLGLSGVSSTGTCGVADPEGAICDGSWVYADLQCELGLGCADGGCHRPPSSGTPASFFTSSEGCDYSLSFNASITGGGSTCEPLFPDGAPCAFSSQCSSGDCSHSGQCQDLLCPEP